MHDIDIKMMNNDNGFNFCYYDDSKTLYRTTLNQIGRSRQINQYDIIDEYDPDHIVLIILCDMIFQP